MRTYLQHGRRHGPHGSDPIPNLPGISWISGYQNSISVASGSTSYTQVDLTSSTYYTNDTAIFSVVASNGLTISSGKDGLYVAQVYVNFACSGATSSGAAEVAWNLSGFGSDEIRGGAAYLPSFLANSALVTATQAFPLIGSSASPISLKQTGGATATVDVQFVVYRLTDDIGNF